MATKKAASTKSKNTPHARSVKRASTEKVPPRLEHTKSGGNRLIVRTRALLDRRPHRSFRLTRRRDYKRSLKLPGYFGFTGHVVKTLWARKNTYVLLVAVFSIITMTLASTFSQSTFVQLSDILTETSSDILGGDIDQISQAGLLLLSFGGGALSGDITEAQQILAFIVFVLVWLTIVWLLRAQLAGGAPRLRDGLYNAGSPIVASSLLFLLFLVQLIPGALAIIILNAAYTSELLGFGFLPFVVALGSLLLIIFSVYLVVSSIFALVVVTLPGMYPWRALRTAGDLVTGRRLRILYRLTWMVLVMFVVWALVMIPIIIFATWLQGVWPFFEHIPLVPVCLTIMSTIGIVFVSAYVYLLYRKVVDDDASPA